MRNIIVNCVIVCGFLQATAQQAAIWPKEKANAWYMQQGWLTGCDYIPASAINQLEMWQQETFDPATIDKELGWAQSIGFKVIRVYLHDIAWQTDPAGFKQRMNRFLDIAGKHQIKVLFTIFDDCWNPEPKAGKQPLPKPGIHNSGWVRSPDIHVHNDSARWEPLHKYVTDILTTFKNDPRILMWDLYNEPGNSGYGMTSLPLLQKAFQWAWAVRPSQPLTSATWFDNKVYNDWQLSHSDVITFHNYNDVASLEKEIQDKLPLGRPLICSEYMARPRKSTFMTHLPVFKKYNVGAINWGFVSGKTNTIYQWDTPVPDGSAPKVWFHDIFRKDGTPYDEKEVLFIKQINGK